MCIRDSPSGASGANFEAMSGPAQFQVRTPGAISAFSINAGTRSFLPGLTSEEKQPVERLVGRHRPAPTE
eukprot:11887201-Alexandrium_andersonii.AAC.1